MVTVTQQFARLKFTIKEDKLIIAVPGLYDDVSYVMDAFDVLMFIASNMVTKKKELEHETPKTVWNNTWVGSIIEHVEFSFAPQRANTYTSDLT